MSPISTFQHWIELQNINEILARSRARYKNSSSRSKTVPAKKVTTTSQNDSNNRSRYVRNRGPKMSSGKTDVEEKRAVQNEAKRSIRTTRTDDAGLYVEHELPATGNDAECESREGRKTQPGKFSTDLYHITSRNIANQSDRSTLPLNEDLLTPAPDEDIYSAKKSHIRQFRKANSFLGMDDDIPQSKFAENSQPDTSRKASGDWEMFYFEQNEPRYQDTVSTAVVELAGSSISNKSDPSETLGDIPLILRPGRSWPTRMVAEKPVSQAARVEDARTFPLPNALRNELFLSCHECPEILWSRSPCQQSKLRGYIASMRERHSIPYKAYKKSDSRPNQFLKCPKEITLT